jgi:hypothetical protein
LLGWPIGCWWWKCVCAVLVGEWICGCEVWVVVCVGWCQWVEELDWP